MTGRFAAGRVAGHRNFLTGDYFLVDSDEAFDLPCSWAIGQATQLVRMSIGPFPQLVPPFPFGRTILGTRAVGDSADPAGGGVMSLAG